MTTRSELNEYLVPLKVHLEEARENLDPRSFATLASILIIYLQAQFDKEEEPAA